MIEMYMAAPDESPATKADLAALEQRFERHLEQRLSALEEKLVETMRDTQTELLRGLRLEAR